jgi:hypothetical protein
MSWRYIRYDQPDILPISALYIYISGSENIVCSSSSRPFLLPCFSGGGQLTAAIYFGWDRETAAAAAKEKERKER